MTRECLEMDLNFVCLEIRGESCSKSRLNSIGNNKRDHDKMLFSILTTN